MEEASVRWLDSSLALGPLGHRAERHFALAGGPVTSVAGPGSRTSFSSRHASVASDMNNFKGSFEGVREVLMQTNEDAGTVCS